MRRNSEAPVKFLFCLSVLEGKAYHLFGLISEKVELPRIKYSLLYVAYDSLKNSVILSELCKSFTVSEVETKDYESILGEVWKTIVKLSDEISKLKKITKKDLVHFADRLISVYAFLTVELKTLRCMSKEISELYAVDLDVLEDIFDLVIADEENDAEVLMTLKDISVENSVPSPVFVKYTNPDRWY